MPRVGKKYFPYTPEGIREAQAYASKTGQPVVVDAVKVFRAKKSKRRVRKRRGDASSPVTRPMATPATGALMGTPASISDRVLPQTLAMEVLPLLDSTSETRRMV